MYIECSVVYFFLFSRPHISGSVSVDVCSMNQYDIMLRAVLNLPLPEKSEELRYRGNTYCGVIPLKQTVESSTSFELEMLNKSLSVPNCFGHWYGVSDGIIGQVLGHITVIADDTSQLIEEVLKLGLESVESAEFSSGKSAGSIVAIVANSVEDLAAVRGAVKTFQEFEIAYDVCIASAQLTPSRVYAFTESVPTKGYVAIIAASRGEPHLATMITSMTTVPVIAHVIPDFPPLVDDTRGHITSRGEGCFGRIVSGDGLEPALLAIRVAASSGGSRSIPSNEICSRLQNKLLQRNMDVEGRILKDALRLESIGFDQFIKESKK